MAKDLKLDEYQHRLTPDEAQRQQEIRKNLLKLYDDVHPSSYAPIVKDTGGVTYRYFVRKGDVLDNPATMVEVREKARK
jgi:hypothetical protein